MVQNRPPVQWPQKDPSVNLPESQYLDLSLRIMALELTQSSEGKKQFRMEFLPRMGKIEVLCTFKNQNASQVDRSEWQERLTWEIRLVQTGIQDLLEGLEISHGFDSKEHLVLRFQIEDSQPHELAVYRDGKINWLVLPSKTS
jgi:hypothetical protein